MAAGIKILSMMMSLIIVSISEITPWVFSNAEASENSVILDAACFDSVLSIPSEAIFTNETEEPEALTVTEKTTEAFTAATESVSESVTIALPKATTDAVEEEEKVTEETATEEETKTEEAESIACGKILVGSDSMLWPVSFKSEVVEGFPRYSSGRAHHGVDIFVISSNGNNRDGNGGSLSYGKPFRAAQSGVVVEAANNGKYNTGYGNYCVIDHGDGTQTLYAHAKYIGVSIGDTVKQGQTIGEIGGTGNTTSPHLHFEVRLNGQRVNPLNYVSEP